MTNEERLEKADAIADLRLLAEIPTWRTEGQLRIACRVNVMRGYDWNFNTKQWVFEPIPTKEINK